jgi:hypothetical protein
MAVSNRADILTNPKIHAKIVDNITKSPTLASRLMRMGKPFYGKTMDFVVKVEDSGLGQWFSGLETLNTQASDPRVKLSFEQAAFSQPKVTVMTEAFENLDGEITLNVANIDDAIAEAVSALGSAVYGAGSGSQPNGLGNLVDDGTTAATVGGQSRSTYTSLQGTVTDSGGAMTLAKIGTLLSSTSDGGGRDRTSLIVSDTTVGDLYETLLTPQVRSDYQYSGRKVLPLAGSSIVSPADIVGGTGFTAYTFRGIPWITDKNATSGTLFALNENYLMWVGRDRVPNGFSSHISRVNMGTSKMEGTAGEKSFSAPGWFVQKDQMSPNQAGIIGRYFCIGNFVTSQPRRHGKLTGITSAA